MVKPHQSGEYGDVYHADKENQSEIVSKLSVLSSMYACLTQIEASLL